MSLMLDEQPLAKGETFTSGEALTLRQADQAWPEGRDWPQSGQARADFAAKAIWNSS